MCHNTQLYFSDRLLSDLFVVFCKHLLVLLHEIQEFPHKRAMHVCPYLNQRRVVVVSFVKLIVFLSYLFHLQTKTLGNGICGCSHITRFLSQL